MKKVLGRHGCKSFLSSALSNGTICPMAFIKALRRLWAILSANCENEPGVLARWAACAPLHCTDLAGQSIWIGNVASLRFQGRQRNVFLCEGLKRQVAVGRSYEIDSSMPEGVLKVHISAKLKRKRGIKDGTLLRPKKYEFH